MSQENEGPIKGFPANAAIAAYLRVKLSAGYLAVSGATDEDIGTAKEDVFVGGLFPSVVSAPVRLKNGMGTRKMVAAGAFSAGARVYQAAAGKIDDTAGTKSIGIALEAATTDGDVVEVLTDYEGGDGLVFVSGEVTLDGANPTPVATGLSTISHAGVSLKSAIALGVDPGSVTHDFTGSDGTLNVYAWKPTSNSNPTVIASTNNTFVASWWARGTR